MPEIGEIKLRRCGTMRRLSKSLWKPCPICGKLRWTRYYPKNKEYPCLSCGRKGNKNRYSGGRRKQGAYIAVLITRDDFYSPMIYHKAGEHTGYVFEHRLVMAKHLGRNLQPFERVHHKNGIKDDNSIENLELTTKHNHSLDHSKGYRDGFDKGLLDGRSKRIRQLETKVKELEDYIGQRNGIT